MRVYIEDSRLTPFAWRRRLRRRRLAFGDETFRREGYVALRLQLSNAGPTAVGLSKVVE